VVCDLLPTPSGELWFTGWTHITHYDGETITPVVLFAGSGFRGRMVTEDRQGRLWIGSFEGVVLKVEA
jgi:ligand-binding sensor domain-containing protein